MQGPALPHGEHPRLLARMVHYRRNVASREHACVRRRLERVRHLDEALAVDGEAGGGRPPRRARLGRPDHLVNGMSGSALDEEDARRHLGHPRAGMHPDAARVQHPHEPGAHTPVVRRKNAGRRTEQVERRRVVRPAGLGQHSAQRVLHGKRELDAGRPGAHDADLQRTPRRPHTRLQLLPARDKGADRLDRYAVDLRARDGQRRPRADVDRQHVVRHRRPVPAQHRPGAEVEPHHFVVVQAGAGEPCQRPQIDVRVVESIVPGNQARQHAGVRRVDVARDHGHTQAGDGVHPEQLQHDRVTVPAADQDEVLQHGRGWAVHRLLTWPPASDASTSIRSAPAPNRRGSGSRLTTRYASRGKSKK